MSKDIWMYFSFIHIIFNNVVISNVSCSFLLQANVSSKYRVEPESIKSNDNDILS